MRFGLRHLLLATAAAGGLIALVLGVIRGPEMTGIGWTIWMGAAVFSLCLWFLPATLFDRLWLMAIVWMILSVYFLLTWIFTTDILFGDSQGPPVRLMAAMGSASAGLASLAGWLVKLIVDWRRRVRSLGGSGPASRSRWILAGMLVAALMMGLLSILSALIALSST